MGATVGRGRGDRLVCSARRIALCGILILAASGCARDDVAPIARPPISALEPVIETPPVGVQPPIAVAAPVVVSAPVSAPPARPSPSRGGPVVSSEDLAVLRARDLLVPVADVRPASLIGSFRHARGSRLHRALDIRAPRGTPVLASDDGTILKLFTSSSGGRTIYVADSTRMFIYYYAHLDAYAPALVEGQTVVKGQQIGTVGTTGNAPSKSPHLHFAILRNNDMARWWTGTAIDPFLILRSIAVP